MMAPGMFITVDGGRYPIVQVALTQTNAGTPQTIAAAPGAGFKNILISYLSSAAIARDNTISDGTQSMTLRNAANGTQVLTPCDAGWFEGADNAALTVDSSTGASTSAIFARYVVVPTRVADAGV